MMDTTYNVGNARRFQRPCGGFMEDNRLFLSGTVLLPVPLETSGKPLIDFLLSK